MPMLMSLRQNLRIILVLAALFAVCALSTGESYLSVVADNSGAIRTGNLERPQVALMINVDWGEEFLPQMIDVLEQKGAHVTFFVVGRWARNNPDLLRQMATRGHEIASHGDQHKLATRLNDVELNTLISEGVSTLRGILGRDPAPLFAPPSGDCDARVVAAATRQGLQTILWTLDTVDWKRPPPAQIVARIVPKATPGALVLMHPTRPTMEALPEMIDGLRRKGLEPVTVSQVIAP